MCIAVIADFVLSQGLNNVGTLIVPQVSCEFAGQMKASGYMPFGLRSSFGPLGLYGLPLMW